MKLKINKFTSKNIQTSRGDAEVYNFQSGGQWYSSFAATWNKDWHEGMELEVADSQIRRKEKNGKIYLTIMAPARPSTSTNTNNASQDRVLDALRLIYKELQEIKKAVGIKAEGELRR
jgi:hypothetical protein